MLTYNEFKKWNAVCNKTFYNKLGPIFEQEPFKDKRANRIYLYPKIVTDYKLQSEIKDFLNNNGYKVVDEIDGICVQITADKRTKKSPVKIGKILTKLGSPNLLTEYTNKRTLYALDTNDYCIVISRHPYDVIGVSTRRKWTSCIDLHEKTYNGLHLAGKFTDLLRAGSMAAYLIRKDDKNITDPVARINFQQSSGKIYLYESHGKPNDTFFKTINDWLVKVNQILSTKTS